MLMVWSVAPELRAHSQVEHLKVAYKAQGDALFVPLYWLPETRRTVREHIPDHENWVGFEQRLWEEVKEGDRQRLLEELGQKFDRMEDARLNATWDRIWNWQSIRAQLGLLMTFLDSEEGFLDIAYDDPLLRPAFDWIKERRPADFDTAHIGSTLSAGEAELFSPVLVEHLLNSPEKQRLRCFSRLFAVIAETKTTKAGQDTDGQPTTRPEPE